MMHKTSLLFLSLAGLITFPVPTVAQYNSDGGCAVQPVLEEHLDREWKEHTENSTYTAQMMRDGRKQGTYWWAHRGDLLHGSFNGTTRSQVLWEGNTPNSGCALALYYDDMKSRLAQYKKEEVEKKGNHDYMRPIAIAPICQDIGAVKTDYAKGKGSNDNVLLWIDMRKDTSNDSYLLLSNMRNSTAEDFVDAGRFARTTMKTDDGAGGLEANVDRQANFTQWYGAPFSAETLLQWADTYADSVKGDRSDRYPNPYKYGLGDKIYSDWNSANDFWGYEGSGDSRHWKVLKDEDKPARRRRSRDERALGA